MCYASVAGKMIKPINIVTAVLTKESVREVNAWAVGEWA